jgi:hypothetical protein
MAQPLQSINLVAPGFKGINTEDSPLAQDPSFAETADNAVIDKRGRVAARKGHVVLTTDKTELGTASIRTIKEFRDNAGNTKIFSVGNNKILSGTTTLVDETPAAYTITEDNWKLVDFNDKIYFFQRDYQPLVYDNTSGVVSRLSTVAGSAGVTSAMYGNEVLAAYGRLWTADITDDKSTVYWSDLLIGQDWSGGTSGSINISKVWPDGYDEIVALAAHNNSLIIFGTHSIVIYGGADAPASMQLTDTISGVGCVDRDTVQNTGTDILFLSYTGLRSIGRTIQEKSAPISSLSSNITKDIIFSLQNETEFYRTVYSPEENFYLLSFVGQNIIYCFDVRGQLENGAYRVTRWLSTGFSAFTRTDTGTLYIGTSNGISEYSGYSDNNTTYRFTYYSPSLTFDNPARVKMLKKIKPTIVGANNADVFLKWAYDFNTVYNTEKLDLLAGGVVGEFNISEYNTNAQYTTGSLVTSRRNVNTTGYGTTISVGMEADINGSALSLQEINVMALIGKIL